MRHSCSASYNPAIDKEQLDERIDKATLLSAKNRSMMQAYYICYRFQAESEKNKRRRLH